MSTRDATVLTFSFTVPANVTGLFFDWMYASEEYPDQSVTDIAGVIVDGTNYLSFEDGSAVQYLRGQNDEEFTDSTAGGLNTVYDGMTAPAMMVAGLDGEASTHTISIAVSDTGDSSYDSALYIAANSFGYDVSTATAGDDRLVGSNTAGDRADGLDGNDSIYGLGGDDTLAGGAGNDTLVGGAGNDTLDGGEGDDWLIGDDGDDTYVYRYGDGSDTIFDTGGTDTILYSDTTSADTLLTALWNGNDLEFHLDDGGTPTIVDHYAGNAVERVVDEDGDVSYLATGLDVSGESDDYLIAGTNSGETLIGGAGNDDLYGNGGDDVLIGGAGQDFLNGGSGSDVFRYTAATDSDVNNADRITDFDPSEDLISFFGFLDMEGVDYVGTDGTDPFVADNGIIEVWFDDIDKILYADTDDSGTADMAFDLSDVDGTQLDGENFDFDGQPQFLD